MRKSVFILLFTILSVSLFAQSQIQDIKKGNRYYDKEKYVEAEVAYRKALQKDSKSFEANFNLGDALYRQKKYSEAAEQFKIAASLAGNNKKRMAALYHNLGNSLLEEKQIEQSIEAYKQALRNNPNDNESRYNLAYAQQLLKQQQDQQQQDQQKQDQNKQDQNKQDQDKQDQDQQQQDKQDQDKQQQQQQQQEQSQMSRENAEQILKALEQDEKDVQDRVKEEQKSHSKHFNVEKDW